MSGNNAKKNRNSSQMRNKALPVSTEQPVNAPFTSSLEAFSGSTREKLGKAKNKQQSKVMLGMPDIPIERHLDNDAYVTKIGGVPIWLSDNQHPENAIQTCGCCNGPMYLIFQGYVPLEDSIYHRAMYVWACNRRICIKKPGSIKALRAHLVDPEYLKQQKKKEAAKIRKEEQIKSAQKRNAIVGTANGSPFQLGDLWSSSTGPSISAGNPFAATTTPSKANPFQMPTIENIDEEDPQLVDGKPGPLKRNVSNFSSQFADKLTIQEEEEEEEEEEDVSNVSDSTFVCRKRFPGYYLYICEEEVGESYDALGTDMSKYQKYLDLQQAEENADDSEEGVSWAGEAYEKQQLPRGFDKAFKRFTERVSAWPEQCVRYEFGGSPLLFSNSDQAARSLIAASSDGYGVYSSASLPTCSHCGSNRTFEFQLMPNTLSLLSVTQHAMEEEQTTDKTGMDQWNVGMEFGTVMVFVCEKDCNGSAANDLEDKVTYFEEHVVAQFELD